MRTNMWRPSRPIIPYNQFEIVLCAHITNEEMNMRTSTRSSCTAATDHSLPTAIIEEVHVSTFVGTDVVMLLILYWQSWRMEKWFVWWISTKNLLFRCARSTRCWILNRSIVGCLCLMGQVRSFWQVEGASIWDLSGLNFGLDLFIRTTSVTYFFEGLGPIGGDQEPVCSH